MNLSVVLLMIFSVTLNMNVFKAEDTERIFDEEDIVQMIDTAVSAEKVPGTSILFTQANEMTFYNTGYADKSKGIRTTNETLYELGSTTKAFTALAILVLEDDGLISLDDQVQKYIPWLDTRYEGKSVPITIRQLLYHSSGLDDKTLNRFPAGTDPALLEETVKLANDYELLFEPSTDYSYANIGYDMLAYIVEIVSNDSFETFVEERILKPLGMYNSTFSYDDAMSSGQMSLGYKHLFMGAAHYNAPRYQGCMGDGYLITCTKDMGLWIDAQLNQDGLTPQIKRVIEKSHVVDEKNTIVVGTYNGTSLYYNYGWDMTDDGSYMSHNGSNPNYTSIVIIHPDLQEAVVVLSNIEGSHLYYISNNLLKYHHGQKMEIPIPIRHASEVLYSIMCIIGVILLLLMIIRLCFIKKFIRKCRNKHKQLKQSVVVVKASINGLLLILMVLLPYLAGYNYHMLFVWMPFTLLLVVIIYSTVFLVALLRYILMFYLIKDIKKS